MPRIHCQIVPVDEVPSEDLRMSGGSPPVVLVVDDEPNVANSLAMILSNVGFEARAAYNGESALLMVGERPPAFLLTDVFMPGIDGIQLAIAVAQNFPSCKVTLFSGNASERETRRAHEAGYEFPLLMKPIHPEKIVEHIWMRLSEPPELGTKFETRQYA